MAIYGYTKNYKLIKPKYDTDTWHDYEYDNLDTIDAVLSAIFSSGDWQGFWKSNTHYNVGGIVIDQTTDTMYKVMVEHTTSAGSFAAEQTAHPTYYELWSPNDLAEDWATKTDGKVSDTDYSSKAYAISSGLINGGSAKEWAVKSGKIGNTNEYSAKKYATDAHNDYISMTTNPNVAAVSSSIKNVNAVGQSISSVNTVATNISDINTAATNISTIRYAPTAASNAAQAANDASSNARASAKSATSAAQSATASATSANNSHIWAEGTDAQVQALGGVHSSKGWAQQSTSVNISLTNTPYTTNRILEIPQDIKLELNNGTLTLKAGSKVYVPNGFKADGTTPKFDEVVISRDLTNTATINAQLAITVYSNRLAPFFLSKCFSGGSAPTSPTNGTLWYDTASNKMKVYANSIWNERNDCLPIALLTANGSQYTSIDQVFNGFGHIGSTIFALPGVKVQIPNGRNADGTLKSIEYTTDRMVTHTFPSDWTTYYVYTLLRMDTGFPSIFVSTTVGLSENNYIVINGVEDRTIKGITLFRCSYKNGRINTDYQPYTVDSVLNSNLSNLSAAGQAKFDAKANVSLSNIDAAGQAKFDAKADINLSNLNNTGNAAASNLNSKGIRTVIETYVNGSEWYRIYSDGWIEQGGVAEKSQINIAQGLTFLKKFANNTYTSLAIVDALDEDGYNYFATTAQEDATGTKLSIYTRGHGGTIDARKCHWYACGF